MLVNAKKFIYFRRAGVESEVIRLPLEGSYLKQESGALYKTWQKTGAPRDQETWENLLAEEQRIVRQVLGNAMQLADDLAASPLKMPSPDRKRLRAFEAELAAQEREVSELERQALEAEANAQVDLQARLDNAAFHVDSEEEHIDLFGEAASSYDLLSRGS